VRLLRNRFVNLPLTPWQRLQVRVSRIQFKLRKGAEEIGNRLFAKARERAYFDKYYPFLDAGSQPGTWVPDSSAPVGRRWEGLAQWRTRIGPATVCWHWGEPYMKAWNVRLPDGSRSDLRDSVAGWRRRAEPPLVWIYGRLVLHDADIEFVDSDGQFPYEPPPLGALPNLEAELARSQDFVLALQDDAFALTAFSELNHRDWMKIGHREFDVFESGGSLAGMIAGLRGKGENYLDVRNEWLSGREKVPQGSYSPDQARRVHRELAKIGWRTHTAEEIQAARREDMRQRLRDRVKLLRALKDLEARPQQSFQPWIKEPPTVPLAMPMYDGDDPAWIEPMSAEEQEAVSADVCVRLSTLAVTARISEDEYRALQPLLAWDLGPFLGVPIAKRPDSTR
jgi:hypothetical protein